MEIKNKINILLNNQKEVIKEYEDLIKEFDLNNLVEENIKQKEDIDNYKKNIEILNNDKLLLSKDNMNLKLSLKEQMLNEKTAILKGSKKKIEIYFRNATNKNINELKNLENKATKKIDELRIMASKELDSTNEIFKEISNVEKHLKEKIKENKESFNNQKQNILDELKAEYQSLKNKEISEEALEKKKKYNDLEVKIGLNLINKLGMILILLGSITAMKYTYTNWLNDYTKAGLGFLLGFLFLGVGEFFNKKNKTLFGLGLTGGGIGVLYLSVFSSYFIFDILNMSLSLFISFIITSLSIYLSSRYNSQTVCGLSLVGGYLPFFSYTLIEGLSGISVYIAMTYLLLLNILVLMLSLKRRWIYINYISFLLNVPCFVYLIFVSDSDWINILYTITIFVMYLGITLIYPLKEKVKLKNIDLLLIGLNTFINSVLLYGLFSAVFKFDFEGMFALFFSVFYFILAKFIERTASQEKGIEKFFYITSLTFFILVVPFQLDLDYISLGFIIESLLLISYARKYNDKKIQKASFVVLITCVFSFYFIDFSFQEYISKFLFRYSVITSGLIYVLLLYAKKLKEDIEFRYEKFGAFLLKYKYFVLIHTFLYVFRLIREFHLKYIDPYVYIGDSFIFDSYFVILIGLSCLAYGYYVLNLNLIKDNITKIFKNILYIIAFTLALLVNLEPITRLSISNYKLFGLLILIGYNILNLYVLKYMSLKIIKLKNLSFDIYPVIINIYVLIISIMFISNQFDFANEDFIISIAFLIAAFYSIFDGFKKNYVALRRTGLFLSIFATAKLFLYDLSFLNTLNKIIAYFCFGIVLISISYIYHRLKINSLDDK